MASIVGIDLGTTNSVLSLMEGGKATVIANAEGSRLTPSVVAYVENGDILVGELARRQTLMNPAGTVSSIKRFMGRRYDELSESELKSLPYEACELLNGDFGLRLQGRAQSPSEISAQILMRLKENAEKYLGHEVKEAVITVPAYFNDAQRRATQVAGEIAGLNVRRIINEPTAAALAYGIDKDRDERIAVFDFGGGTFDISILEIGDGLIEVLSTHGDAKLGGNDIDQRILDFLLERFKAQQGVDLSQDPLVVQRVREAAEKAKIELSSLVETEVFLPFITATETGPKHLQMTLTRAQLEAMIGDLIERCLACCRQALSDAKLEAAALDQVLLVGGSTRIPLVVESLQRFFGKKANHSLNPDEVVALGASIQAGVLSGEVGDLVLLDVTPLTLGVQANGGLMVPIIDRNTTIPTKKMKLFSTSVDNQSSVVIEVFQGEREFVAENRLLGQFELSDIEPAPRAVPQIEVAFDIDANGVLTVSATNKKSQKREKLVLFGSGGLSNDEIRHAISMAEEARERDQARKALQVAKNKAQSAGFGIARAMREWGERASEELIQSSQVLLERSDALLAEADISLESLEELYVDLSASLRAWVELRYEAEAEVAAAASAEEAE